MSHRGLLPADSQLFREKGLFCSVRNSSCTYRKHPCGLLLQCKGDTKVQRYQDWCIKNNNPWLLFSLLIWLFFFWGMQHLVAWPCAPTYTNSTHIDKHLYCHLCSTKGISERGRAPLPLCYWHVSPSWVHSKEYRLPLTFMTGVKLYRYRSF